MPGDFGGCLMDEVLYFGQQGIAIDTTCRQVSFKRLGIECLELLFSEIFDRHRRVNTMCDQCLGFCNLGNGAFVHGIDIDAVGLQQRRVALLHAHCSDKRIGFFAEDATQQIVRGTGHGFRQCLRCPAVLM